MEYEALDFARDMWKVFDLNKSKGAGMTLTENGKVVKHHGNMTDTKRMREMPDSIVFANRGNK